VQDLIDTTTTSETPLAVWFDSETHEVGVPYGYVVISLPVEDFHDLAEAFSAADVQLKT